MGKRRIPKYHFVDGDRLELMMWLVVESRADGIPITMRLCQNQDRMHEELVAAGLCTQAEIDDGTAQERLKPTFHLMWTPSRFVVREKA